MRSLHQFVQEMTLGDLEDEKASLLVRCRTCGQGGRLALQLAIGEHGRDGTLDEVATAHRCRWCGSDAVDVAPDWYPS